MRARNRTLLSVSLAAVFALPMAGCGGGGNSSATSASTATAKFAGTAATPPKSAPGLPLKDYLGHPLSASDLQGKAVLVTFIYTHCPDVCPLIVSHLHAAQDKLGPEAK
jgi:protein SCO1/2